VSDRPRTCLSGRRLCRRATQPRADVVFVPIGCWVSAVLVLRPSRTILACMLVLVRESASECKRVSVSLRSVCVELVSRVSLEVGL